MLAGVTMVHEECEDPDCGCVAHRARRLVRWWEHAVHAVVHPVASTVVLVGAACEVWEGFMHVVEWALHALAGGHP
jgi:hypothetical protein